MESNYLEKGKPHSWLEKPKLIFIRHENTLYSWSIFPKAMCESISPIQITSFASLHEGARLPAWTWSSPRLGGSPRLAGRPASLVSGSWQGWTLSLGVHCCSHYSLCTRHFPSPILSIPHIKEWSLLHKQKTVPSSRKWKINFKPGSIKLLNPLFSEVKNPLCWELAKGKVPFSLQTGSWQLPVLGEVGRACAHLPQRAWEMGETVGLLPWKSAWLTLRRGGDSLNWLRDTCWEKINILIIFPALRNTTAEVFKCYRSQGWGCGKGAQCELTSQISYSNCCAIFSLYC